MSPRDHVDEKQFFAILRDDREIKVGGNRDHRTLVTTRSIKLYPANRKISASRGKDPVTSQEVHFKRRNEKQSRKSRPIRHAFKRGNVMIGTLQCFFLMLQRTCHRGRSYPSSIDMETCAYVLDENALSKLQRHVGGTVQPWKSTASPSIRRSGFTR